MFYHKSHSPYPGELPDLDYQVISVRAQLRLHYEMYRWVRALTWAGFCLLFVLLLLLPGGIPPRVAVLFWQAFSVFGVLLKLHGSAAFVALLVLGFQVLTWLVLWIVLLATCYRLGRYTWSLHRGRVILNSGWLSSPGAIDHSRFATRSERTFSDELPPPTVSSPVVTEAVVSRQVQPAERGSVTSGVSFKQPISLPSISPFRTTVGTTTGDGDFSLDRFLVAVGGTPISPPDQTGMDRTWSPSRPNWTSGETKSSTTKGRS